jgi:rubrerythrin
MNWPLFFSTFCLIFLAELGDKTQLAVMSQSAAASSKWTIFFAGALALTTTTAFGVLAGDILRRVIPDERYIKWAGGLLFLGFGAWMIIETFLPKPAAVAQALPGWAGKFAIRQAEIFERAAMEDYLKLAASASPEARAVFERIAEEERWHHEAMLCALASGAEHDIPIDQAIAARLPDEKDFSPLPSDAATALGHLIKMEHASAQFYEVFSNSCKNPRLKETFAALKVAEENHAKRVEALLQKK